MKARRAAVPVLLAGLVLVYGFCPRPELYEALTWSRAYQDRGGNLLRLTLAQDERYRLFTPLEAIAPAMVEATMRHEDRYFYAHPGVNPIALALQHSPHGPVSGTRRARQNGSPASRLAWAAGATLRYRENESTTRCIPPRELAKPASRRFGR